MAVVLALGAALAYGSADFAGGLAARRSTPLLVALGSQLVGLAVLLGALPVLGHAEVTPSGLAAGAGAGLFGGLGLVVLYRALALGPMSVVAPTTALAASVVPIAAGLAMGDRPGAGTLVGVAVSLVAVLLITRERGEGPAAPAIGRRSVELALLGGALFGAFFVLLHQAGPGAGLVPLAAARLASVPLLAALAWRRGTIRRPIELVTSRAVLVSGALDMGANILYVLALRHGMLTVVAALTGLYPASTVLLAQSRLGERMRGTQLAGLGVAACAALLIAVG